MDYETTIVSCGVDQIAGFEFEEPSMSMEACMALVSRELWYPAFCERHFGGRPRLQCATLLFSDVVDGLGDKFGTWLMEQKFGPVVRMAAKNPNSGNNIATYLWTPNVTALAKYGPWRDGKESARLSSRNRKLAGW